MTIFVLVLLSVVATFVYAVIGAMVATLGRAFHSRNRDSAHYSGGEYYASRGAHHRDMQWRTCGYNSADTLAVWEGLFWPFILPVMLVVGVALGFAGVVAGFAIAAGWLGSHAAELVGGSAVKPTKELSK